MRKLLVFYLLFFLTFSSTQFTQSRQVRVTKKEGRIALVIGNGSYRAFPLRNPVNDANDIADVLKKMGFDVTLKTNASQRTMKNAIRDFGGKLKLGGTGLFYFAGHGMQVKGVNYLIPVGSEIRTEDEIEFEAVDANQILRKMESARNKMNIVILDACRDNPFARSFRSSQNGLARMDAPTGSIIAYSTAPGKTAADGKGRNGVFTKYLLKNISVSGLKIEDVLKRVRKEVMVETDNIQVPWEASSLTGDFYFIPNINSNTQKPAPVYKPKLPPSAQEIDISKLEAEAKENRLAKEREKAAWESWQSKFKGNYSRLLKIDNDNNISASSKKSAWQKLLSNYSQDNPHSREDEQLRTYANERVKYWKKEIQRQNIVSQQITKPSYLPAVVTGTRLRSSYKTMSYDDVKSMLKQKGFFDRHDNKNGDFNNNYKSKTINGDKVVIDRGTGLTWHQSGSSKYMGYDAARQWVQDLNNSGYAGNSDWRLPTLEEGASLLESSEKNGGLYIDPVFSSRQRHIWTGDKSGYGIVWVVLFDCGSAFSLSEFNSHFVRPVRSGQ